MTSNDGICEVEVTHTFKAPPERVYDAWLDANLVRNWFAPGLGQTEPVKIDAKLGGHFRIVQIRDGQPVGHFGQYLVLDRPTHLAFTWLTDGDEGHSEVHVYLAPSDGGSSARLVHAVDEQWKEFADRIHAAWASMLREMDAVLSG